MTNKVVELFGHSTRGSTAPNWAELIRRQPCPFLNRKCVKIRKSQPNIAIGTCTLEYGADKNAIEFSRIGSSNASRFSQTACTC